MNKTQKAKRRISFVLREFEVMVLHICGYVPSHHFRRFAYRIAGMRIGVGSSIHTGLHLYDPAGIQIGDDTIVGESAVLDGRDRLVIGSHVDIASDVMIYNSQHDIDSPSFAPISSPVTVGDYVFIGPRAIILPGVTLGEGAVVGAGAVVAKDVEPYSVVGGVPAKEIRKRNLQKPTYKLGRAAWFR